MRPPEEDFEIMVNDPSWQGTGRKVAIARISRQAGSYSGYRQQYLP